MAVLSDEERWSMSCLARLPDLDSHDEHDHDLADVAKCILALAKWIDDQEEKQGPEWTTVETDGEVAVGTIRNCTATADEAHGISFEELAAG